MSTAHVGATRLEARFRTHLEAILSADRLAAYSRGNNDSVEMVTNYSWNIALCKALYPSLGNLEVAVRNSIHAALMAHFGRDDWYDIPTMLQQREARQVQRAKTSIENAGKTVTAGRVIASLRFGFWISIMDSLYGNAPSGPQLWRSPNSPLLAAVVPHAPVSIKPYRGRVFARLDDIRLLRNRVFHYEPVFSQVTLPSRRRGQAVRRVPIQDLHLDIQETIGWISPSFRQIVHEFDSFPDVFHHGYAETERTIRQLVMNQGGTTPGTRVTD